MINRRCLEQDSRGVGEALNETNRYNDQGKNYFNIIPVTFNNNIIVIVYIQDQNNL